MKLIASLIVGNEADRYLHDCLAHLTEFCDLIVAIDDGSTDGTNQILHGHGAVVRRNETSEFYTHEGLARQGLLELTMAQHPTHILAIDADEFISDGHALRSILTAQRAAGAVWSLSMEEVWRATPEQLQIRTDGNWGPWPVPCVYTVPTRINPRIWRIRDDALACGRVPMQIQQLAGRARHSGVSILHFGWANEGDRYRRYHRYVVHDGGRFHQNSHLESIMWTSDKVKLTPREWPLALLKWRDRIVDRANREREPGSSQSPPTDAAFVRVHDDGRWVALDYEGTILTGTL